MRSSLRLLALSLPLSSADNPPNRKSGIIPATPHDSYSSSIGVLGCKINTNRVAYWPSPVDCDNICLSLRRGNRGLHLLRVDQSEGAYDISYDAWNYLYTGYAATERPVAGGPVEMEFQNVAPSKCADLIHTKGSKLPLSAANSINFLASCLSKPDSWVAKNSALFNILDPICTSGVDEKCALKWPDSNQPTCPSTLGVPKKLENAPVYNIRYPTGEKVLASSGASNDISGDTSGTASNNDAASPLRRRHGFWDWVLRSSRGLLLLWMML